MHPPSFVVALGLVRNQSTAFVHLGLGIGKVTKVRGHSCLRGDCVLLSSSCPSSLAVELGLV